MGIVNFGVLWDDMPHSAPAPNSGPSALHLQGKVSTTTPGKTGAMTGDVRPHRRRRGGLAASDTDRSVRLVQLQLGGGHVHPGQAAKKYTGHGQVCSLTPVGFWLGQVGPLLSSLSYSLGAGGSRREATRKLRNTG